MTEALVIFFSDSADGERNLVGIGLTDDMIYALKREGSILESADKTNSGTDVLLFYAPTLNELVSKIRRTLGNDNTTVTIH